MTVHRYAREYFNPTGQSPNTPMAHTYDRTRPGAPPRTMHATRGFCPHGYTVTAAGCRCPRCDECPSCRHYMPAGMEHMPA